MRKTYTVAAIPKDDVKGEVAILDLKPMTLVKAENIAKYHNEWNKHWLDKYKFSHCVAFNYEALNHEIPFDLFGESL